MQIITIFQKLSVGDAQHVDICISSTCIIDVKLIEFFVYSISLHHYLVGQSMCIKRLTHLMKL